MYVCGVCVCVCVRVRERVLYSARVLCERVCHRERYVERERERETEREGERNPKERGGSDNWSTGMQCLVPVDDSLSAHANHISNR